MSISPHCESVSATGGQHEQLAGLLDTNRAGLLGGADAMCGATAAALLHIKLKKTKKKGGVNYREQCFILP